MRNKLKSSKGFTLIEFIVVAAILGILVLLAGPKLLGYREQAELAAIKNDVRIMEQEMTLALIDGEVDTAHWNNNKKNLGALVMQDKLYEREGIASRVDARHLSKGGLLIVNNIEFDEIMPSGDLGVGGDMYLIGNESNSVDETYKIIPKEYKDAIGTRLKGTFYTSDIGKVYYEHDNQIIDEEIKNVTLDCPLPLPDYDFEQETGEIVKWSGTETNLIIPSAFKMTIDGEEKCVPVRIIGKDAFMESGLKSVVIPESVTRIEENAFKDNQLTEVTIPHSVEYIGENAFAGNNFGEGSVIIRNSPSNITVMPGAFGSSSPIYKPVSPKDLNIIFDPSSGRIVSAQPGNKVITIPESFWIGGVEYPVKEIGKGAYQGHGLISVILPSGLERIGDYAFAGNQLEGVTIPDKVNHIGNYAFAFNEVVHSETGHRKTTIGFIDIKNEEQLHKVNQDGDIYENGLKVDKLKEEVKLLNHIFVTSIGNHVIDEEYVGKNDEISDDDEINDDDEIDVGDDDDEIHVRDIVFRGLSPEVYDGDLNTYSDVTGDVSWLGDLDNRAITITTYSSTNSYSPNYGIHIAFYDKNGNELFPIGSNNKRLHHVANKTTTTSVIVPEGSDIIKFTSSLGNNPVVQIQEIELPESMELPSSIGNVDVETNHHGVYMNWEDTEENMKYAIYRDNVFLEYVNEPRYDDISLYSEHDYSYEIIPINKYGNAGPRKNVEVKTSIAPIIYSGLEPMAFDNNLDTYSSTLGDVTWEGNLDNKEITITTYSSTNSYSPNYGIYIAFYDEDGEELFPIGSDNKRLHHVANKTTTTSVIVPEGSEVIKFTSSLGNNPAARVYEVSLPKSMLHPSSIGNVDVETNHHGVYMNWENTEEDMKYAIYRDNVFLEYVDEPRYDDISLYGDHNYSYKIIPINKYGNAGPSKNIEVKTSRPDILFKGLPPEAFDNNLDTYSSVVGDVTWEGDLDNKEISITTYSSTRNSGSAYGIFIAFYDENGEELFPVGSNNKRLHHVANKTTITTSVIVPEGSKRIAIISNLGGSPVIRIHDVSVKQ